MLSFFAQYWGTLLVGAAVAAAVAAIVVQQVRRRKQGGTSCGCGCSKCPYSGQCHH